MKLVNLITGLFKTASKGSIVSRVAAAKALVEGFVTDESVKKQYAVLMEQVEQSSQSTIARTARGALMWGVGVVLVYQGVIRDVIALLVGADLSKGCSVSTELIEKVIALLAGA